MGNPISALEGVSNLFQWIYVGVTSVWQSVVLITVLLIFIGIQIAFVYFYFRVFNMILNAYPNVKAFFEKVDRFFQ